MLFVAEPILGAEEKAALSGVIDDGWITMGERVMEFEKAFAHMHGEDDSVAVSSCTAGLHLIMHALGIGKGDEVLVPSLTFVASANCILYVGAKPVFVDIESIDTPLMSLEDAAAKCTARTRAVVVVHYAGYLADRDKWRRFADERDLLLIEDAAHATGMPEAGTYGVAAAFSFYGNKNMTTAEGGAVIARDQALRERIRQMRGHGLTSGTFQRVSRPALTYDVTMLGYNYRMDELRAALGLVQLQHLSRWNAKRKDLCEKYRHLLKERTPEISVPFTAEHRSAYHIMPIVLPAAVDREEAILRLREAGIQTSIHYPPAHTLSLYKELSPGVSLPITEDYSSRELTLPLHPRLEDEHVDRVTQAIAEVVAQVA